MCCDTVNRGLSYAEGKIFLYQADTTLVALDSKNGKLVWKVKNYPLFYLSVWFYKVELKSYYLDLVSNRSKPFFHY
jgi:glucose dehydrogenase